MNIRITTYIIFLKMKNRRAVCTSASRVSGKCYFAVSLALFLVVLAPFDESLKGHTAKRDSNNDDNNRNPVAHQVLSRSHQEPHNSSSEPIQSQADIIASKTDQSHTGYRAKHGLYHPPNKLSYCFHDLDPPKCFSLKYGIKPIILYHI